MRKILVFVLFIMFTIFTSPASFAINEIPEGEGLNIMPGNVTPRNLYYVKCLGFDTVRTGIPWGSVEKTKGTYDWTEYDKLINALLSKNLRPMIVLGFNNKLYGAGNWFTGISTQEQRDAFTRYTEAIVNRYKGKGIIWEIWNEPNIGNFWKPKPNYKDYAIIANSVASAIKKVAPTEVVIAPAAAWPGSREILTACGQYGVFNYLDGISYHFYPRVALTKNINPEAIGIGNVRNMINELSKTYTSDHKKLPIVSSEAGYSTVWPGMSEIKQAQYLSRQIVLNKVNGIKLSIWHNLWDAEFSCTDPEHNFGLVRTDYSLKPAYSAVKTTLKNLKGFSYVKKWDLKNSQDYAYEFAGGSRRVLFIWTAGGPHNVKINGETKLLNNNIKVISL